MLTVHIEKKLSHFTIDVSFSVQDEIVALFGPSGSGKTTILQCITGLVTPERGTITLGERTLFKGNEVNVPVPKRKIGYIFQDYALFPHMTVWKNVAYAMKCEQFAHKLMEQLQIAHLTHMYPHEISGGEKQRVAIARALVTEPDVLLLDEPFSALDDDTKKKSHDELLRIQKDWQIPIILVTHNRKEANKLANRILFLRDGVFV